MKTDQDTKKYKRFKIIDKENTTKKKIKGVIKINDKLKKLRQLKQQILNVECNLHTLKQNNLKSSFEYAKIKMAQLKQLKLEFQQIEQQLHNLLDKGVNND